MTLHIDVVLTKAGEELIKHVYYTVAYRCDQGLEDTLCITENVLKEIKKDLPDVTKIYMKSNNAGCYHGNYSAEINQLICKLENIKLLRYDFNEPQKGKDQCDREAAAAKNQLRAYVEGGNDIDNDIDIYNALHYAKGLKNSKVCVVDISTQDTNLNCSKTKDISTYHSVAFEDNEMKMRRYYGIGKGVTQKYSDCSFQSGLNVKMPFHSTEPSPIMVTSTPKPNSKKTVCEDRQLCTLYFCATAGCKGTFENKPDYDAHLIAGNHEFTKECGALDTVKKMFVSKMKSLSSSHEVYTSEPKTVLTSISTEVPMMSRFSEAGWALPIRSNFRYSYKQKKYLYNQFMEGEISGKKKSPEQVHLDMRKDFDVEEYVTVQQIKSLFSRMSTEKRKGTLTEPKMSTNVDKDTEAYNGEHDDDVVDDVTDNVDDADLRNTALSILTELTVECEKWVMVLYQGEMFPGVVKKIFDGGIIRIQCMEYEENKKNKFRWPTVLDINDYVYENIINSIEAPGVIGVSAKNKRKDVYAVTENDWCNASEFICNYDM